MLVFALVACSEYDFGSSPDLVGLPDETGPSSEGPGVTGNGDDHTGDDGTGDSGGEGSTDTGPLDGCTDGYYADYFNLPADHPDVEQDITGVTPGDDPFNHDWYDAHYLSFTQVDPGLEFGDQWWPVDDGLAGDPQYYAVHWVATLQVDQDGPVSFELGSDDDGWAFLDGAKVADLGGIHGVAATSFTVEMAAGLHALDLYMAERHTSDAGFWFRWTTDGVRIFACP